MPYFGSRYDSRTSKTYSFNIFYILPFTALNDLAISFLDF
jgi:hypothetical protein